MKKIKLNGKDYHFRWSFYAAREYSRLTGKGLEHLSAEVTIDEMVNITYCGLKAGAKLGSRDFDLDVDDVAVLIDGEAEKNGLKFFDMVVEAIKEDIPKITGQGNLNGVKKAPKSGTK